MVNKLLAVAFSVLLITGSCFAQVKSPVDTSVAKKLEGKAEGKINEVKDYYISQIKGAVNKYNPLSKLNNAKVTFSGTVSAVGEYVSNSNLPVQSNGFYSHTGISGGVQIGSLPFKASVIINYRNNKVWADYTLMNLSFDTKNFTAGLKSSYLDYLSDMGNFFPKDLAGMVKGYSDSLNRFNDLRNTMSDPSYYDKLRQYNKQYNSLQDSIFKQTADSCTVDEYNRISDSIAKYKNIAKEFESLDKYKSANKDLQKQLDFYNGYIDSVKNMKDILSDAGVKNELRKSGILSKGEQAFGGIQKMGIGRVNFQLSDYTSRSQSVLGFNFDYLFKDIIYTGVGLGVASPNNFQFNPSFTNLNQPLKINFSKFIGYFRIGIGKPEQDHLHLIYLSYGEKFSSNTSNINTYQPAPANSVLSLVFKKGVKEAVSFEGEVATSNSSFSERKATFSPFYTENKKWKPNFAIKTVISGQIKKTRTQMSVKANAISPNYQSAGNLFQRRDYADYGITLAQPLLKNCLNISTIYAHNFTGAFSGLNPSSFINLTSNIRATPFSSATYILQHTYTKQINKLTSGGLNNHLISFIQQYTYGGKKVQCSTIATVNYTQNKSGTNEFARENRVLQGNLAQHFVVGKGFGISVSSGVSMMSTNNVFQKPAYWVETGNSFNIKQKCTLQYSVKYMKDMSGYDNVYSTMSITATLYKGLQLRATEQLQVMFALNRMINTHTVLGMSYNFSYTLKKPIQLKFTTKKIVPDLLDKKVKFDY